MKVSCIDSGSVTESNLGRKAVIVTVAVISEVTVMVAAKETVIATVTEWLWQR